MRRITGTCKTALQASRRYPLAIDFSRALSLFLRAFSLCYLLFLSNLSSANDFIYRTVFSNQLAQIGKINAIAQDKKGFVWFGGDNGLARYDGHSVKLFQKSERGLTSNRINDLHVSVDDVLWVVTPHGLSRYDAELEQFQSNIFPGSHVEFDAVNNFICIEEGIQRRLWLGGERGLFTYDRDSRSLNQIQLDIFGAASLNNAGMKSIVKDSYGRVWVATKSKGVVMLNAVGDEQILFSVVYKNGQKLAAPAASKLYLDNNSTVWLASMAGELFRFSRSTNRFEYVDIFACNAADQACDSTGVTSLLWDDNGVLYVSSEQGLKVFYPAASERGSSEQSATSKLGGGASVIFKDKKHNLWFGYPSAKVDVARRDTQRMATIQAPSKSGLSPFNILSLAKDEDRVWLGTDRGLYYLKNNRTTLSAYPFFSKETANGKEQAISISSLIADKQENLWLAIQGVGVARWSLSANQLYVYSVELGNAASASQFLAKAQITEDTSVGLSPNVVYQDSESTIWVASELGLAYYNRDKDQFIAVAQAPADSSQIFIVNEIFEDRSGNLWVASNAGLYLVDKSSMALVAQKLSLATKMSHKVRTLFEDSKQRLWLSLARGGVGVYDKEKRSFSRVTALADLSDVTVTRIQEDDTGVLWFASRVGLFRYDSEREVLKLLGTSDGLTESLNAAHSVIKLNSGELLLAANKKLIRLDPKWYGKNVLPQKVVFTGFNLFNRPVTIAGEESSLQTSIAYASSVALSAKDKVVSFEFSAMNYLNPGSNQYAYLLQGRDQSWQPLGFDNQLTFSNLAPGSYVLMVRSDNGYGVWSEDSTKLEITVQAPWWKTWWAYTLYVILALLAMFGVGTMVVKYRACVKQKDLNIRLQELDKLKDEFLANTSHELRMPVNGMVSVAESLKHEIREKVTKEELKKIDVILACGHSLFTLIDDILDYSKLTDGSLELNKEAVDLYKLTDVVFSLLETLVAGKPIVLVNALSPDMPRVYADENRLSQVLINLVSNAIKFSEKGYVTVGASFSEGRALISVEDNGVGIQPDRLDTIFEPFHHQEGASKGMGLGLYITQKLVHLHGGEIRVKSQGVGTEVLFDLDLSPENPGNLPANPARATSANNKNTNAKRNADSDQIFIGESMPELIAAPDNSQNFVVLIVDDDPVNRMILQGVLAIHDYQVLEAEDGDQALTVLSEKQVNLVILDVMMPGLSGYETCMKIREKFSIHQLPVIFLSARNSDKDLFNGYNAGGNEFIFKPVTRSNLLPKVAVQVRLQQSIGASA